MQIHSIRWILLEAAEGAEHSHCKAMLYHPGRSWQIKEVPYEQKKTNITPVFRRLGRQTQIITDLQSNISPQNCKQTLLEALARHMYDRSMIGKSQQI